MNLDDLTQTLDEIDVNSAETFRKTQETAILIIMFIDMAKSTETREKMGEIAFERFREERKRRFTSLIEANNAGKVVKDLGDGLLAVFALPDLAVKIALRLQESLTNDACQIRIGLDMGQVTQELEKQIVRDVFGRHVNRAARIEALGDGGHVLVSYAVWDNAKGWLKHLETIAWKAHGSYRLKGIAEPQAVYEAYQAQLTQPMAALRGEKVHADEELAYCKLCGRYVKLQATFTCRTCGATDVCTEYCYDSQRRQCIECAAKATSSEGISPPEEEFVLSPEFEVAEHPSFDVLLCYAPRDKTFVSRLTAYLKHEGLSVWLDEEQIDLGDRILDKTRQGMACSRFIVVCLSKHFNASQWQRQEYLALLAHEIETRNASVLPVIVGEYHDADVPALLYDKYLVDIRAEEGLERLLRKLRVQPAQPAGVQPAAAPAPTPPPEEVLLALKDVEDQLLHLSNPRQFDDELVFEFDKIGLRLLDAFARFPAHVAAFHDLVSEYRQAAEHILGHLADSELRRVFLFRLNRLEDAIEDVSGANCGESFLSKYALTDSPFIFDVSDDFELARTIKKLLSRDELEESEGLDWLLRDGFSTAKTRLERIAAPTVAQLSQVLWKRAPRIFLYYNESFWDVIKFMLEREGIKWKLRFYAMKTLLTRSLTCEEAEEILQNFLEDEQHVFYAFLALHPKRECRALALGKLPDESKWDILVCPSVPLLIVRELVEHICQKMSASYVKAMFLLLRPRLLAADKPLTIWETYNILYRFYQHPVFMEETFFHALIDLHQQVSQKTQISPTTAQIEKEFQQSFQKFCAKSVMKDADVQEMTHIPLPIQRKLAHDGYFPKYFICNNRDVIALETIPHVERRPDIVNFFRLRVINGKALERLATNKLIMREYPNRAEFCRHPKANPLHVRNYLATLTRSDMKQLSVDKNASVFAREMAKKYLTLGTEA